MGQDLGRMILGAALGAALVVCLPSPFDLESPAEVGAASGTSVLRLGFMQSIDSLNPFVGRNDASRFFYNLVYDALAGLGNDLEVVPNLATSEWSVPVGYDADPKLVGMPYGSVWQYNLSTNTHWTDGKPFTADDVVYNMELISFPHTRSGFWVPSAYSYFIHEAWRTDDYTVRISFWDPATGKPMPAAYAYRLPTLMLPKHLMEQLPGGFSYIGMNWTGTYPDEVSHGMPIVGTGPFIATPNIDSEWVSGDHITLLKNPDCHWALDYGKEIKFNQMILKFFYSASSMVDALRRSEIDAAAYPLTVYDSIKDEIAFGTLKNVTFFDVPKVTQDFIYVGFCMAESGPNPSRLDPVIRQALHTATNKTHVSESMYLGHAEKGTTLIPPINTYWHYEPTADELFDYNLEEAKAMLDAAGYIDTDGNGYRDCTIGSTAVVMGWVKDGTDLEYQMLVRKEYPEENDIAQYLKSQWQEIGVLLNCTLVEELTLSQRAYLSNYDTLIWSWSADPDPNSILWAQSRSAWDSSSRDRYYNPAFDENYTESVRSMDEVQRKIHVNNCQKMYYNDSACIILAYPHTTYALRNDTVSGWGNWMVHPGRSLDSLWTGNPLFFDLEVKETVDSTSPMSVFADYWWIAAVAAIAVALTTALIYLSRKRTS